MPVARLRYRLRIFPAGEGRFGRAGYVALALDLSGDQFALLGALGRLTLRCEDQREVDFFVLPTADGDGGQVLPVGGARLSLPPITQPAAPRQSCGTDG